MRLLFVADGRSPIAINWINYFLEEGDEVHLISTFPSQADQRLASFNLVPVGFSSLKTEDKLAETVKPRQGGIWGAKSVRLRTRLRQWFGPATIAPAAKKVQRLVQEIRPQLVHAMRIPFEGMLAARAKSTTPLLVSVWGNDFTLHARANPWMGRLTKNTLRQVDALHSDCYRDLRLAESWGFDPGKPGLVVPGAGGIQLENFYPPKKSASEVAQHSLNVINPRGIRVYIQNEVFFRSIPLVLGQQPEVKFFCPAMAGDPQAEKWVHELGIEGNTYLLPKQSRQEMADLFRQSCVVVSPSTHDGTPNTLLEAMACGCFPVAGDLESLREWITPNKNGLLVNPNDPHALADAILKGLSDGVLREKAERINQQIIAERADYWTVMQKVRRFYTEMLE